MDSSVMDVETSRSALLAALGALANDAAPVRMMWLQGSLAASTADPWSDIDAYLAIEDDSLAEVWSKRNQWLDDLGGALAVCDATTPGLRAVHALMPGGVRLDLFFEPVSSLAAMTRPSVKVRLDKDGLEPRLRLGSPASREQVGAIIKIILRMTRQGSTWPLRLLGRGEWATLAMMEIDLINAQIAQLMAVSRDPGNFYVNPFAIKARLDEQQRAELDHLTALALDALIKRDTAALKSVHLQVFDTLGREGRRACQALDTDYPVTVENERSIRALLEALWPL